MRHNLFHTLLIGGCLTLAGCGVALDTVNYAIDEDGIVTGNICQGTEGAYSLPRHVIPVQVTFRAADQNRAATYQLEISDETAVADPGHSFCLDFISSFVSEDNIEYDIRDGLLQQITTTFSDRTIDIANEVVESVANAAVASLGGNRSAVGINGEADNRQFLVASYNLDLFNQRQMKKINEALEELDHCVFLDPANDPYVPDWHDELCDPSYNASGHRPSRAIFKSADEDELEKKPLQKGLSTKGVVYRPLLTHKLIVLKRNKNPRGSDNRRKRKWDIFETRRVKMSTAAPSFLLEVKRSALVDRNMSIEFEDGVLQTVNLSKESEALAASEFILQTAQTVLSIPTRVLVFGRTDADNRARLLEAQSQLIDTLETRGRSREEFRRELASPGNIPIRSGNRNASGTFNGNGVNGQNRQASNVNQSLAFEVCVRNRRLQQPNSDADEFCRGALANAAVSQ